jgi:hypothetical protein
MIVNAKVKVEIDLEAADEIVRTSLKEDYVCVRQNIRNIEDIMKFEAVSSYVLEDLEYDKRLIEALSTVLAYHMAHDDHVKFIEENK